MLKKKSNGWTIYNIRNERIFVKIKDFIFLSAIEFFFYNLTKKLFFIFFMAKIIIIKLHKKESKICGKSLGQIYIMVIWRTIFNLYIHMIINKKKKNLPDFAIYLG